MKGEACSVQAQSACADRAVPLISDDGVAQVSAVYAQLVCAARHWLKLDERDALSSLKHAQARLGWFAALHDSPLRLPFRVATYGRADEAFVHFDTTSRQREIA